MARDRTANELYFETEIKSLNEIIKRIKLDISLLKAQMHNLQKMNVIIQAALHEQFNEI